MTCYELMTGFIGFLGGSRQFILVLVAWMRLIP